MFSNKRTRKVLAALVVAGLSIGGGLFLGGCGNSEKTAAAGANVKVMKVLKQDVSGSHEYSGQVKAVDAVSVKPRISGSITEKYFTSGQFVSQGDPLYKIDDRQYRSAVLSASSNVEKAQTTLNNSIIDLNRYQSLADSGAISEQTLTTQQATVDNNQSNLQDMEALLEQAKENLDDTVVRAPISGKLSINEVGTGNYVTAGNTELVSIGSVQPIYVQFAISENEFLSAQDSGSHNDGENMTIPTASLTLSNGTKIDETSTNYIIDREVESSTGTITIKALFNNTDHKLLPGMFARVKVTGAPQKDALLVPEKAIQQVLDKSYVIVCGKDNKSETKIVTLGDKVGSYYVVKSGITADDMVVVEGLTNLKAGQELSPTTVTGDDLGLSLTTDETTTTGSSSSSTSSASSK